jgi:SAM-dependent methyltransferase
VALYDTVNPFSEDTAFYLALAAEQPGSAVIDVGCGTGALACALARRGHRVTGVDPSLAMLDRARHRLDGASVEWIHGGADQLLDVGADLALMTGHVAQVIGDDAEWLRTLVGVHGALRDGGRLAFECRNPDGQPWQAWTPERSRRQVDDDAVGAVDVWAEVVDVQAGRVRFEYHNRIVATGEELISLNELRFRTEQELTMQLHDVGFRLDGVFGDWDLRPVDPQSPELIFVATRR